MDSMVKNDLALKGTFEGVELLIFPSNQLPGNCQRKDYFKIKILLLVGLYALKFDPRPGQIEGFVCLSAPHQVAL